VFIVITNCSPISFPFFFSIMRFRAPTTETENNPLEQIRNNRGHRDSVFLFFFLFFSFFFPFFTDNGNESRLTEPTRIYPFCFFIYQITSSRVLPLRSVYFGHILWGWFARARTSLGSCLFFVCFAAHIYLFFPFSFSSFFPSALFFIRCKNT
jgi:hypothetical protein